MSVPTDRVRVRVSVRVRVRVRVSMRVRVRVRFEPASESGDVGMCPSHGSPLILYGLVPTVVRGNEESEHAQTIIRGHHTHTT
jgi:hypothetical protein